MTNTTDLKPDGSRSCFLDTTLLGGDRARAVRAVDLVLSAWGATKCHWLDQNLITRSSRRSAMIRFADGLWRHCSFGGLEGAPMAHAEAQGYTATTGAEADARRRLALNQAERQALLRRVVLQEQRADGIRAELVALGVAVD